MSFRKILVTGGTGFFGRQVVAELRGEGFEVHSCSRREGIDICNGESFASYLAELSPDCIVHCAAHVGGIAYVRDHAVEVFEDNLRIALGLMQGIFSAGEPYLVNVMPNCTYPGDKEVYREPEWWDGAIHDSVLMYGLPRKTLWGLAETYGRERDWHSSNLIFPNMYGPYDHFDPQKSHALGALIAKIVEAREKGQEQVIVWGTGKPVREWIYVSDAAKAIGDYLKVVDGDSDKMFNRAAQLQFSTIFNVGIGQGVSIRELAETICEVVDWDGELVFDHTRPDGAAQKLLDGSSFACLTGWRPATTLKEGIVQTVAWYEHYALGSSSNGH